MKVHEGFDYWVGENVEDPTGEVAAGLERANAAAAPTVRLESVDAAYWTQIGDRRYLRWVMPHAEDTLLDALARLHAAGSSALTRGDPPDRVVPRARCAGSGLGAAGRCRGCGPGEAGRGVRARRSTRRWRAKAPLTTEERAARAGLAEPAADDPLAA